MYQNPSENLTYFLYARKSSDSEDRQIQSIDDQINRLKDLAKTHHFKIKEIFTEARSAKKPNNRPIFAEMISRIEKGEANAVLCWEINRLSRNPIESGLLSWHLQQGTIKCIQTIDRKFLPDDNVVVFNVESSIANQYIIDLRKNCMRGMVGKAERGWLPSLPPIGYLNDRLTGEITEDPERLHLVKKIWELTLTGNYTPQMIRKIANFEWGFRTRKFKHHGGNQLSNSLIYKILSNIFYCGLFEFAGNIYIGKHKRIITTEEYDRVQEILGRKGKPRAKSHDFSYTGMIRCQCCESMYTAETKFKLNKSSGQIKKYTYYRCTRKRKGKVSKCVGQKPVTLFDLENQILKELSHYNIIPEFYNWAKEIINEMKLNSVQDKYQIEQSLRSSILETEKELSSLIRMRYKEMIDDTAFTMEQYQLKITLAFLRDNLNGCSETNEKTYVNLVKIFDFAANSIVYFNLGSKIEKKEVFSILGSNFSILNKKLCFEPSEMLLPIRNTYKTLEEEFYGIELNKKLDFKGRKVKIDAIRQRWRASIEDVRTVLVTSDNNKFIKIPELKPPDQPKDPETLLLAA